MHAFVRTAGHDLCASLILVNTGMKHAVDLGRALPLVISRAGASAIYDTLGQTARDSVMAFVLEMAEYIRISATPMLVKTPFVAVVHRVVDATIYLRVKSVCTVDSALSKKLYKNQTIAFMGVKIIVN